jgi:hypothetical protein
MALIMATPGTAGRTRLGIFALLSCVFAAAPRADAWPAEVTRELAVRERPWQEYLDIEVSPAGTVFDIQHCDVDRT